MISLDDLAKRLAALERDALKAKRPLLSSKDTAAFLGWSIRTLHELRVTGVLTEYGIAWRQNGVGGRLQYVRASLEAYVAALGQGAL